MWVCATWLACSGMRTAQASIIHIYPPIDPPPYPSIYTPLKACIDDGLLLVAAGPTVVRFVPPLIVTEAEVDEAVRR